MPSNDLTSGVSPTGTRLHEVLPVVKAVLVARCTLCAAVAATVRSRVTHASVIAEGAEAQAGRRREHVATLG